MSSNWTLHWLEAAAPLEPVHKAGITRQITQAEQSLAAHLHVPPLDILISRRTRRETIPERGIGAFAHHPALFSVNCDPDNPAFDQSLLNGGLLRLVLHEVNHCLRMAGPGYGRTLGEALVSEGLTGHFVQSITGSTPEPWEDACTQAELRQHMPTAAQAANLYTHDDWFFGTADKPFWYGYSVGYSLVKRFCDDTPQATIDDLVNTPAYKILAASSLA